MLLVCACAQRTNKSTESGRGRVEQGVRWNLVACCCFRGLASRHIKPQAAYKEVSTHYYVSSFSLVHSFDMFRMQHAPYDVTMEPKLTSSGCNMLLTMSHWSLNLQQAVQEDSYLYPTGMHEHAEDLV